MEHTRLKSDNNVLYKVSGSKNSKIEEFRIFYLSFFAYQSLVTVSSVDKLQNTIVYGTTFSSSSRLAFDPRPTRLCFTVIEVELD